MCSTPFRGDWFGVECAELIEYMTVSLTCPIKSGVSPPSKRSYRGDGGRGLCRPGRREVVGQAAADLAKPTLEHAGERCSPVRDDGTLAMRPSGHLLEQIRPVGLIKDLIEVGAGEHLGTPCIDLGTSKPHATVPARAGGGFVGLLEVLSARLDVSRTFSGAEPNAPRVQMRVDRAPGFGDTAVMLRQRFGEGEP